MPYDDVYAIATPGRVFDMFTNQAHALRSGPRRPGGSLMLFTGAQAAAALMRESDEVIVERFLADLYAMYPQTRGVDREREGPALGARQRLREPRPRRASSPPWRARSAPTRTCTWPATTSPSWGRWRPPPRPGSRPPNASTHEFERSPMSDFHGVLPALITPFTEDGSAIDTDALAAFVERLIGAGVGGLVPGGSTGEFTTLTNAERKQLVEVTDRRRRRPRPRGRGHRGALDARDGRAERARRAGRGGRGDDHPAVLRRALVA